MRERETQKQPKIRPEEFWLNRIEERKFKYCWMSSTHTKTMLVKKKSSNEYRHPNQVLKWMKPKKLLNKSKQPANQPKKRATKYVMMIEWPDDDNDGKFLKKNF